MSSDGDWAAVAPRTLGGKDEYHPESLKVTSVDLLGEVGDCLGSNRRTGQVTWLLGPDTALLQLT